MGKFSIARVSNGAAFIGCSPADAACASAFIGSFGRRAFRRSLSPDELTRYEAIYDAGVEKLRDATAALKHVTTAILASPYFLYRVELGAPNTAFASGRALTSVELASKLRDRTIELYREARAYALTRGLILADTKFEFGFIDGELAVIDEVLTPDSSRFWDGERYAPGQSPPSFDKQFMRDFVSASGWNKEPPPPILPDDVIVGTRDRYVAAYERLTGRPWG